MPQAKSIEMIDDPTYIFQDREVKDRFVLSGLVVVGNHELYHGVVLGDVDKDDVSGRGVVGVRLARR